MENREIAHIFRQEELEAAARAGRIRTLPRMGARTEERILAGIEALRGRLADLEARGEALEQGRPSQTSPVQSGLLPGAGLLLLGLIWGSGAGKRGATHLEGASLLHYAIYLPLVLRDR